MKTLASVFWGLVLAALFLLGLVLCSGIAGQFIYNQF